MLRIIATNYIISEKREVFLSLVKPLIEQSRKEEGCLSYSLFEDTKTANVFTFIEDWRDQEAIDFHRNTLHFIEYVPQIKSFASRESIINIYSEVINNCGHVRS